MSQIEYILQAIANLEAISRDCDPASGVSFVVRRGVMRNNPGDALDDEGHRPKVVVETCELELARNIIEQLKSSLKRSLKEVWLPDALRVIAENQRLGTLASEYLETGKLPATFINTKKRS